MKKTLKKIENMIKKNEKNVFVLGLVLVVLGVVSKFLLEENDEDGEQKELRATPLIKPCWPVKPIYKRMFLIQRGIIFN